MEGQLKKKLIKYLLEDKVCNLVTEIFSTEGESVPAPNTEVFLRRSIIEPAEPGFSYQPLLLKEENTLRFFEPIAKEERLIILEVVTFPSIYVSLPQKQDLLSG